MSNVIPLITRKVVCEYHLLGLVIIMSYLMCSLHADIFWEILPVISTTSLCLVAAGIVFRFKRPLWLHTLSFTKNQIQQLIFDISPYLFTALVVMLMEALVINQPLLLVSKVVIAIISIGFYTAVGIALEVEYEHIKNHQGYEAKNITQIIPAACKWRYFHLILLIIALLIFSLVWLDHSLDGNHHDFQELFFISR
ncbi:MAG: hypothetical protein EXR80_07640 [Methylococcales bacterium]|nr:hypothetical protein [Methylococcales bacterium]